MSNTIDSGAVFNIMSNTIDSGTVFNIMSNTINRVVQSLIL